MTTNEQGKIVRSHDLKRLLDESLSLTPAPYSAILQNRLNGRRALHLPVGLA